MKELKKERKKERKTGRHRTVNAEVNARQDSEWLEALLPSRSVIGQNRATNDNGPR